MMKFPLSPTRSSTNWRCGTHLLPIGQRTLIMGIVNATPDSFSGDGKLGKNAINTAQRMVDEGADIIDIGGESTRPGAAKVETQEEIQRILPILDALASRDGVALSVDTNKSAVAKAALEHGAHIINDISGGTFDKQMFPTIAASNCGYILMHLRGTPQSMKWSQIDGQASKDVIAEIIHFWKSQIEIAQNCGIERDRIALDPGFGFGKSAQENLQTLQRGAELHAVGHPLLCAVSRKSTIGKILGDVPPQKRLWGTAACTAIAINNGYDMIRVHDVAEMRQVAQLADAINTA